MVKGLDSGLSKLKWCRCKFGGSI